jgi:uncharacterized membrane protein
MTDDYPRSTARIGGHPIHPMLVPFPIACFVGTLVTDIAFARTADLQWANFSSWLLTFGVIFTVLAAIAGAIDFVAEPRIRRLQPAWIHVVGNVIVLILAVLNALIHTRDAYGPMPTGLILSVLTVLILLVTGWNGWEMVYRHGVSILPERRP